MALAQSETQFEQSENGTVYGMHTERVAVQKDNGQWVMGIRQTLAALVPLPNGAVGVVTRTREAVGIGGVHTVSGHNTTRRNTGQQSIQPPPEEGMSCCSMLVLSLTVLLCVLWLLYMIATPITMITLTATKHPTTTEQPCSSFTSRTASVAYAGAAFLLATLCLCCTFICCFGCTNEREGSVLISCCTLCVGVLLFIAILGVIGTLIAENVVVFKDISLAQGDGCGGGNQPSFISAILFDVAVGLSVLLLSCCCCLKCCLK